MSSKGVMKYFSVSLFVVFILSSCSGNNDSSSKDETTDSDEIFLNDSVEEEIADSLMLFTEIEIPESADELFDDFLYNFISDKKYQKQRIHFPLNIQSTEETEKISKNEWDTFNQFNPNSLYTVIYEREQDLHIQSDTTLTEARVDWIDLDDKDINQYQFKRITGKWILTNVVKTDVQAMRDNDFIDFLSEFISDTLYQNESINEPLYLNAESSDEMEETQITELNPEEWAELRKELPMPRGTVATINYGQPTLGENTRILLVQSISSDFYMKYKFGKLNGKWRLTEIEF